MNQNLLIFFGVAAVIGLAILWYIITRFLVNIGATEVGIKERRYLGTKMAQGRVVATDGEIGIQAEVLKPGLHFVLYPIVRVVQKVPLVEIGADELGVIEAIDGEPMPMGSNFAPDRAQNAHNNFQDPIAFIKQGGVKGIQLRTLPPGKWAIHPYLFNVSIAKTTMVPPGKIGVMTSADGLQLGPGFSRCVFSMRRSFRKTRSVWSKRSTAHSSTRVIMSRKPRPDTITFRIRIPLSRAAVSAVRRKIFFCPELITSIR